ncbi:hypothetical protein F5880DRAFT_1512493 [Lentinula raphanica]|nr:hypothetical protein F5880DRAFT_1512493 [Lentinula raphanica]
MSESSESNPPEEKKSHHFTTGNVAFRSSDDVLFRMDQWHLVFVSKIFPPICCLPDEVVQLHEDSETLELLFTFVYPDLSIPDIGSLSFDTLKKLFVAADKYAFNAVIEICLAHFHRFAQTHPFEILTLAGPYNHRSLLTAVAPYAVNLTPELLAALGFSADLCVKWKKYREDWWSTILASREILNGHDYQCIAWNERLHPGLLNHIYPVAGPAYRLVKGNNTKGQQGMWEVCEIMMHRLERLPEDWYGDLTCCKYQLRRWFDHVSDALQDVKFKA